MEQEKVELTKKDPQTKVVLHPETSKKSTTAANQEPNSESTSRTKQFLKSKWTIVTASVAIVAALVLGLVTAFCPPVGLAALAMGLASLYAGAGAAAMGLTIATFSAIAAIAVGAIGALLKGATVGVKAVAKHFNDKQSDDKQHVGAAAAAAHASGSSSTANMSAALGRASNATATAVIKEGRMGTPPPASPEQHSSPLLSRASESADAHQKQDDPSAAPSHSIDTLQQATISPT